MQFENYSQFAWDVTVGIIVGIAMIPVSLFASALNEAIIGPQPQAGYIKGAYSAASPLELLMLLSSVMFVVAPVEEIIFRGFVQQGFEKSFGRGKGLTAASLFFALVHLSAWSIFPLTILGMMLGLCFRVRHNRVLAPIISHALYMVFLVFSVST
jgi:membrane protease YdiL (CAAX protease family)